MRSIGSSLLFKKNFAFQQVLRTRMYKPQTMFSLFYHKDVTHRTMDAFFIGPVVAAQQIF